MPIGLVRLVQFGAVYLSNVEVHSNGLTLFGYRKLIRFRPAQYLARAATEQPFFIAFRQAVGASDAKQRLTVGVVINGYGVVAGPHQPVCAERINNAAELRDQIAIGKLLAR